MDTLFKSKKNIILIAIILVILAISITTLVILYTKNKKQSISKISSNIKSSNEITNEIKNNTDNIIENSTEEITENTIESENVIEAATKPTTSPTGTTKPSTTPTNTGTTTTPSNTGNTGTTTQPSTPTTPSTPTPTPVYATGKFVYKPNYSVQSQIIAQLNNIIANTEIHQVTGTTVTSGSSCSSGRYTYRGVSSFTSGSLNAGRTNYVYAEDEYSVMSDGSEQATGMTYYSIY